jgi:3D (Asp-Asp-Asp) domain-containing protein
VFVINKKTETAVLCVMIIVCIVGMYFCIAHKHITVYRGGKKTSYFTFAHKVNDVIKERGIKANFGSKPDSIELKESETKYYNTMSVALDADVFDGMSIIIYENSIAKTAEFRKIPAPLIKEWDVFLDNGQERILKAGSDGLIKSTIVTEIKDGIVISRQKTGSQIVVKERPVMVASGSYTQISRGMNNRRFGKPQRFEATAYSYTGHRTAVGAKTRRGIVAVDPRVIKMGTRMFIKGYGFGVAADTGGAIKGKKIDLYFENYHDAVKWGRKPVDVYFVSGVKG